ncbi:MULTISPECIES: translation initiation factor IF-2 [Aerococcus]|uniref:Translation initiation factor IF-2 n=1 Tax=Aerococcus sanguinicola TaxID=119206 RepID=A0A5N1GLX4_9LACT|nr:MULTISPECIES: translation initiation factor IF-2 [Aerococcus]KAA9301975.1 translation initiation factor IF-2 [Aerococcus sanguinicola]MDK6368600.1 translation initiation factor IF-2 [Aerococcus sp. UMB9870]MDK6679683.1 translation initiation factor IF-2 [Aerococcus sp. UMB8608]MDK6686045.1 translation initiation factor IF-2 [Aerococcus sp. UMB8623]MDK6940851.1 translation initiation factor IF-2 [Aerococcus sp. UMB8487]
MSKKRVYEYAKEKNLSSKEVLKKAKEAGLEFKSHMSSMSDDQIKQLDQALAKKKDQDKPAQTKKKTQKNVKQASGKDNKSNTKKDQAKGNMSNNKNKKKNQNKGQRKQNKNHKNNHKHPNYNKRKKIHHDQPKNNKPKELPEKVVFTDGMTVAELAKKIKRSPADIIKKLFMMGIMATQNESLERDAIELILDDYGIEAEEKVIVDRSDFDHYFEEAANEEEDKLKNRPAVVTIMGHVDHGKTTLLDYLRQANVVEGEAGGITQHIGAYQVKANDELITFLDTPGHAAFTTMRARGADVTDIVIIVVAADDGVMPQTVEAINHAKAADVPIIVAVNKIDKPTANPDRVKNELMEYGLVPEEWGGDTIFVNISAKFGENIDELLEMVLLISEVEEYKANPDTYAIGSVIEARLDAHRGAIATVLVQNGTLHTGDAIVVGDTYGRVRTMVNDQGRRIHDAAPSTPVEITGLQEAPSAGDRFVVFEDEKTARTVGEERASRAQEERRQAHTKVTLDNLFDTIKEGQMKTVNVIIKADVQGSAEALAGSLRKIDVEDVRVDIVHSAVGAVNESDVTLASASNAIIIGFNVRPTPQAKTQAQAEDVEIRLHNVIYNAIQEIEDAMTGLLDPEYEEQVTGEVVIRETYKVSKVGTIGGAYVTNGVIRRSSKVRVIRDNIVIYDGELASLRRFKDDVKEVSKGFECGLMIENYNDIKVDDIIEPYEMVEIKRK